MSRITRIRHDRTGRTEASELLATKMHRKHQIGEETARHSTKTCSSAFIGWVLHRESRCPGKPNQLSPSALNRVDFGLDRSELPKEFLTEANRGNGDRDSLCSLRFLLFKFPNLLRFRTPFPKHGSVQLALESPSAFALRRRDFLEFRLGRGAVSV